ncbi:MAG: hypothetical protein GX050_07385 [Firmicutes bacterium]|nr:hypothetical protein [Bacillota bacterium]
MRKLWLFPLILFILLLLAGVWRWEKGPCQEHEDFQVLHMKDQWTGQNWFVVYGGFEDFLPAAGGRPYPMYSGEWIPHLTRVEFEEQMDLMLAQPEHQSKWQGYQTRLRELEEVKSSNQAGYERYLALAESSSRTQAEVDEALFLSYQAWLEADQKLEESTWELTTFYTELTEEMVAEYKAAAEQRKRIATYVWLGLLLVTFVFSLHYFIMEIKRWKRVNETYEIVEYVTKNNRFTTGR